MACKSDGQFEFCNWKHENEYCYFEWKFASKSVERQQCSTSIRRRMRYIGDSMNNVRECKIQLDSVSLKDQGKWRCELQEYCLGDCKGPKDVKYIDLKVNEKEEKFPSIGKNSIQSIFIYKNLFYCSHNPSHWSLYPDVLKIKTLIVVKQNFAKMPFVYY